ERNASSIRELIAHSKEDYQVAAVSSTPVSRDEAIAKGLPPEVVVADVSLATLSRAHLTATPQTLVVKRGGLVASVWAGAFAGANKAAIEKVFGLVLPEIANR